MPQPSPPRRRDDLVIRQTGEGEYVVKLPAKGRFFSIGAVEHFLLQQLDGVQTAKEIRRKFEQEFSSPLSREEFQQFLELAAEMGLLGDESARSGAKTDDRGEDAGDDEDFGSGRGGSVLFYRLPLYDPDRLCNWIEPKIRWVWTKTFLAISLLAILGAGLVTWTQRGEMTQRLLQSARWETLLFVGLIVIVATALHEFAHGLTCKHFGGEVHELGVLFVFFTPCLYCNVSDAWLIGEKRKRLLITLAGGYMDLCLWAMSVFAWQLLAPDTLPHQVTFVLMTVCGSRGFINLNPLLRLDGYYLLSDWLEIPNLRKRSQESFMGHLRWCLWGANRPEAEPRRRPLLLYGLMTWIFALIFLDLVFLQLLKMVNDHFGMVGLGFGLILLCYGLKRVFRGFFASELVMMLKQRYRRTLVWGLLVTGFLVALFTVPVNSHSSGEFRVRGARHEVFSPVSGFLRTIHPREGTAVEQGQPLFVLESPTLENSLVTKQAELDEVRANLKKLRAGARPEQLQASDRQLETLEKWRTQSERLLDRAKLRLEEELRGLDQQIEIAKTKLKFKRKTHEQLEWLHRNQAVAGTQLQQAALEAQLGEAELSQLEITRRARELNGLRSEELELTSVERAIAQAEGEQNVLQAGFRAEEIEAEQAREIRLSQELEFLRQQKEWLVVQAPVSGRVTTAHLEEKLGQLISQGAPLCAIEDAETANIEIFLSEADIQGVEIGQPVKLKVRALPYQTFIGTVRKIAPVTAAASPQQTAAALPPSSSNLLIVYCQLDQPDQQLTSGLTGFARIVRGESSVGEIALRKAVKYIRTEFWY